MRSTILFFGAYVFLWATTADVDHARALYNHTDYAASLKVLLAIPEKDAAAHALIGQNYFMLSDFKKAADSFEKAVAADSGNSEYYHWLGRAYGKRAETSSPITAPGHAVKARKAFEKAIQLDPKNTEAINDLFEYYLDAPGFLGGGIDKAAALSKQIEKLDSIEGHYAQARLAEHRKEFATAEQQFRRAADLAPRQIGRIIDLAKFLAKHGRYLESDQTFSKAEQIDPNSPKLLFERADAYIHSGRNIDTARELLKRYLAARLTPDDPPRSEAQKLLKQVSRG